MKLYIVRHGETDWNKRGIIQGRTDISLNENGIAQAVITKQKLSGIQFDSIYCSPLKRTKETAEIINQEWNFPIIYDERLLERSFGTYEGTQVKDLNFSEFWRFDNISQNHQEETARAFFNRVHSFLNDIINMEYSKILVVAHGGVSLPIYSYFNHIPEANDYVKYMLNNCEFACYDSELLKK